MFVCVSEHVLLCGYVGVRFVEDEGDCGTVWAGILFICDEVVILSDFALEGVYVCVCVGVWMHVLICAYCVCVCVCVCVCEGARGERMYS
jgi:hypothetical protein